MILKPNVREATRAVHPEMEEALVGDALLACGKALRERSGRPVVLTMGEQGITVFHDRGTEHVPAVRVTGPIDIVGAGDATMAGIAAALAAGASLTEAAGIGVRAAAVTIKQLGTTGTASRADIASVG